MHSMNFVSNCITFQNGLGFVMSLVISQHIINYSFIRNEKYKIKPSSKKEFIVSLTVRN